MLLSQLLVVAAVSCVPGLVGVPLPPSLHVAMTPPLGLPGSQVSSFFLSKYLLSGSFLKEPQIGLLFICYLFISGCAVCGIWVP